MNFLKGKSSNYYVVFTLIKDENDKFSIAWKLFEKGGQTEHDFNHDIVWLTTKDVLNFRDAIANDELPKTSGFFFGDSEGRLKEEDINKANIMLDALSDGCLIFYTSSW